MKNYKIEAKTEAEKKKIRNIIKRIGLETKLQIKHKQTEKSCPLEVSCAISYGGGNKKYFKDSLTIHINESAPKLMANDCQWGYLEGNRFASFVFDKVLVTIYFATMQNEPVELTPFFYTKKEKCIHRVTAGDIPPGIGPDHVTLLCEDDELCSDKHKTMRSAR